MAAICLDCRTVLADGEPCDAGPKHRVRALDAGGREALVTEVWGPPPVRAQIKRAATTGGSGAGVGGALEACGEIGSCGDISGGGGEVLAVILVIIAAFLIGFALYFAIRKITAYVRARRNRPRPNGAQRRQARIARHGRRGRVVARGAGEPSPVTGEPCVAWGLELSAKRFAGGAVMLRQARCEEFDVALDDGQRARIPAGRVRIAHTGEVREVDDDDAPLRAHLTALLGGRAGGGAGEDPVPFDRAVETVLRDGDTVELLGDLVPTPDPEVEGGYREAAVILVPGRVAELRRVP